MSLLLRKLLARFLTLPVGEVDPGQEPAADPGAEPAQDDGGTLDDLLGAARDDEPAPRETEPAPTPRPSANEERLSRELETERAVRKALENRPGPTPASPQHDAEFDAEERQLADARSRGLDATSLYWMEWKVKSDRQNRETRRSVEQTLRQTQDVADQTAFRQIGADKPKLYAQYKDRVEAEVQRLRAQGQNAPRAAILAYLVGDDAVNGRIASKTTKTPAPARQEPSQTVDRGRMPGARTDVSGRIKQSEREARRARLEGKPL